VAILLVAFSRFLPDWAVILYGIMGLVFGLFLLGFGFFMWYVRTTMRYELSNSTLTLIGGPVKYQIPLQSIKRVYKHDIYTGASNRPRTNTATAISTPGMALANVTWRDTGLLKMCATPAWHKGWQSVMLIETDKFKYGITPADDEAFLSALHDAGVPTKPGVEET